MIRLFIPLWWCVAAFVPAGSGCHSLPSRTALEEASTPVVATSADLLRLDPTIRTLVCKGISNAELGGLSRFSKLDSLLVWNSHGVTDEGLAEIGRLENLTSLALVWCPRITDSGLVALTALKKLERLDLAGFMGGADLGIELVDEEEEADPAAGPDDLEEELEEFAEAAGTTGSQIGDRGLESITQLRSLVTLVLSGTQVTDNGLRHLAALESLKALDLDETDVSDSGLKWLRELSSLKRLSLRGTRITDAGLEELLRSHPGLGALRLGGCPGVTERGLGRLRDFAHLKEISLGAVEKTSASLTSRGIESLGQCHSLEVIDLRGARSLDTPALDAIVELPELRSLDLSASSISDAGVGALARCEKLESLRLSSCSEVTDAALGYFIKMKRLLILDVQGCLGLSREGVRKLQASMPLCRVIF